MDEHRRAGSRIAREHVPLGTVEPLMVLAVAAVKDQGVAVIVGAGPAGLTAAHELLTRTGHRVVVLERGDYLGGLARTVNYKGNRMDIGGHRFFSKSSRVVDWWHRVMPVEHRPGADPLLDRLDEPIPDNPNRMIERQRISRIFYLQRFFDYPVKLNANTIMNLGPKRMAKIGLSYSKSRLAPIRRESSLEDFLINRFGRELYETFFKDYTEKVWGVPCDRIKPEWGAQRIKGLSVTAALKHALKTLVSGSEAISQKDVETSLIERFLYPKYGPGQLWEDVAQRVESVGGQVLLNHRAVGFRLRGNQIREVTALDTTTGEHRRFEARWVFSTMPIPELLGGFEQSVPEDVRRVASGLMFRDFLTVGILVPRLKVTNQTKVPTRNGLIPDNWIYVQETSVRLGRLQLFQNWSPYMVQDRDKVWLGLEYFCKEGDGLWTLSDSNMIRFAAEELGRIGLIDPDAVIDGTVVRADKTYPAYFGTYDEFAKIRDYTDTIDNLFLIGRNGMHRYNNSDHSMLTAMTAVDNIIAGRSDKSNIWQVNTEQEYHEEK